MSDGTQLSMILDLQRDILKLEKGESYANDKVAYLLKEQDKIKQREQSRTGNLDHFVQANNKTIKDLQRDVQKLDSAEVQAYERVSNHYQYIRANNKTIKELQGQHSITKQLILDVKATACAQAEQIGYLNDKRAKQAEQINRLQDLLQGSRPVNPTPAALAVRDDRIAALTKRVTDLENLSNRVEFSFPKLKGRVSNLENEVILDIERTKCAFAKVKHDIAKLVGMVTGKVPGYQSNSCYTSETAMFNPTKQHVKFGFHVNKEEKSIDIYLDGAKVDKEQWRYRAFKRYL